MSRTPSEPNRLILVDASQWVGDQTGATTRIRLQVASRVQERVRALFSRYPGRWAQMKTHRRLRKARTVRCVNVFAARRAGALTLEELHHISYYIAQESCLLLSPIAVTTRRILLFGNGLYWELPSLVTGTILGTRLPETIQIFLQNYFSPGSHTMRTLQGMKVRTEYWNLLTRGSKTCWIAPVPHRSGPQPSFLRAQAST